MTAQHDDTPEDGARRDFLFLTAGAMAAVGAGSVAWPFIDQMNPAQDTLAVSTTEVDIGPVMIPHHWPDNHWCRQRPSDRESHRS